MRRSDLRESNACCWFGKPEPNHSAKVALVRRPYTRCSDSNEAACAIGTKRELVSRVELDCGTYRVPLLPKTNQRWWRCRELNPRAPLCKSRPRPDGHPRCSHCAAPRFRLLCACPHAKDRTRPFTVSNPRRGAGESNAILLIWNQLGHHDLHPVRLASASLPLLEQDFPARRQGSFATVDLEDPRAERRFVRGSNSSHSLDRGTATASRITKHSRARKGSSLRNSV